MCGIPCCLCSAACCACNLLCKIISIASTILTIIIIVLLVVFLTGGKKDDGGNGNNSTEPFMHRFRRAAVTANGQECAAIGRSILEKDGSAADAAIATLFCDGIACGQCMGLGGGFLLTIYTRETGQVRVLNAREMAGEHANKNMFDDGQSTTEGGLTAAVPGELRGYAELHRQYGKLPWRELIEPTIELCKKGYQVTEYLARILRARTDRIKNETSLAEIFINPETNDVWAEGELIKRPKLAEALEIIAEEGAEALYNGSLTKQFLEDVKSFDGILTEKDMLNYKPEWLEPLEVSLGTDHTLHTIGLPGSGHLIAMLVNTLRGWVFPENIEDREKFEDLDNLTYWHRIVEVFKYTFAKRTGLGDLEGEELAKIQPLLDNMTSIEYGKYLRTLIGDRETFNNYQHYGTEFSILEDHGTAHVSVYAPNGDAVAVTSTINYILGAFRRSRSTGIILNNEMDDFSYPNISNIYGVPPSPTNYPKPGKRPMSSMTPSIIVQRGRGARLVIGAAGGTKIPTQVALIVMKHLLLGTPLKEAIDEPRLHHQLFPMEIEHEFNFDEELVQGLRDIGHYLSRSSENSGFASITAISANRDTGMLEAEYDKRRIGSADGF